MEEDLCILKGKCEQSDSPQACSYLGCKNLKITPYVLIILSLDGGQCILFLILHGSLAQQSEVLAFLHEP